jgi:threonyl-tRNA synthetase
MSRCPTCKPQRRRIDYPGGFVWTHEKSCTLHPGERVGKEKLRTPHEAVSRTAHPAGTASYNLWFRQPKIGPMTEGAAYVDAHVDDEMEEAES